MKKKLIEDGSGIEKCLVAVSEVNVGFSVFYCFYYCLFLYSCFDDFPSTVDEPFHHKSFETSTGNNTSPFDLLNLFSFKWLSKC